MKRVLICLSALLIIAFAVTACGAAAGDNAASSKTASESSAAAGSAAGSTTAEQQVLKVGVDDTYPPMEFKDESNKTVGFDIDVATEVAKRLNMKPEFVSNDWAGIFLALESNKFDAIISSVSRNEERMAKYAMSTPYIANAQVIVVPADDTTIKEPKDLAGKKVGVQIGTTADESCAEYLKTTKFELTQYDQVIQPFSDMKVGRLDAIVVDEVVARYYVKKDPSSYKVSSARLTNEPIGMCFAKNNTELRDKAQKALEDMFADGTMKKISENWFGEDLTGNVKDIK
ncbi:MAG: Amino acid transporter [Eubacterium sp.]|nr:Amino acid transporter [Eubacterium sp.]